MMKIDIWGKHKKNSVVVITDEKGLHQQPLHPPTAGKLQNIEYKPKSPMMIKFRMYLNVIPLDLTYFDFIGKLGDGSSL